MASILIIDDEPSILRVLKTALEKDGHTIVEASDGQIALRRFAGQPTDLIITDIYMPNMDGIELLVRVRDVFPEAKVIAMSGGGYLAQDKVLAAASLLGADEVLEKPFSVELLLGAVQRVLEA